MFTIAVKSLKANISRFVATLLAIAVGVGFLTAGSMIVDSIESSLGGEIDRQYAQVDAAVSPDGDSGERMMNSIPADVLAAVEAAPGVDAAAGVVIGNTKLPDDIAAQSDAEGDDTSDAFDFPIAVRAWITDERLNPLDLVEGRAPEQGEVTVDRGLAEDHDIEVGQDLELGTAAGPETYRVVGITAFGSSDSPDAGGTVTTAADGVFELGGLATPEYAEILVAADAGTSQATLVRNLKAAVAATGSDDSGPSVTGGLRIVDGPTFREDTKGSLGQFFSFLRPVLQGFSGLAIFVCAFVIFNTFNVVVTQRIRELALMRAIAATPKQIRRSLQVEGLGIGLLGSLLGLGLGSLITLALSAVFDALDWDLPEAHILLTPGIVITGTLVGTIVTFLSVLIPSFRAGRTAPVEAMRSASVETVGVSKARLITALVLLVLGVGLMVPANGWLLALGAPMAVIGVFLLGPAIAHWSASLTRPALRLVGIAGRLSSDNIARNPKRTSTTMNALVIGLLLVTLVTVAGNSLKTATVDEVNKYATADYLIAAQSGQIDAGLLDRIEAIDGIGAMTRAARHMVVNDRNGPPFLTAADPADLDAVGIKVSSGSLADLGDGVAIPDLGEGRKVGDTVTFVDPVAGPIELQVRAMLEFSLDTFTFGNVVAPETLERIAPGEGTNLVLLKVDADRRSEVGRELKMLTAGYGNVVVQGGNVFGQVIETVFSFLINIVNGLLGMSVVIAMIGIVNTLTLSIFERRRELGLLRAVGMTAREVRRMIRLEALQMALLGTVVGIASGLGLGWLLIRASDLGELEVQWGRIGLLLLLGLLLGLLASLVPTWRVTRLSVLDAIQSE